MTCCLLDLHVTLPKRVALMVQTLMRGSSQCIIVTAVPSFAALASAILLQQALGKIHIGKDFVQSNVQSNVFFMNYTRLDTTTH
jgi:hypothetical protein